jgi:hypothetical protein
MRDNSKPLYWLGSNLINRPEFGTQQDRLTNRRSTASEADSLELPVGSRYCAWAMR